MSHQSELIATDIEQYLRQHERKELLRLLTCGSVDDGKSTLIGRLLYDSKMIYEDQLAALERDSVSHGTTGGAFDPALLTDGLKAEREQGITIDVAYRYFSTSKRKFIIADTPGHEQYTRNMATGASNCDLAIILVDARNGVVTQTRRHSFIVSLLGIRHVVVAVNKMDLVDYSESVFDTIRSDYTGFAARLEMDDIHFIPMSALLGDNVVDKSVRMPWYGGSTLMHLLENVTIASDRNLIDFRMPVQYVNRPHLDFRGYCGSVASGVVRKGDEVMVLPSRQSARVASIVSFDGDLEEAFPPAAVTLTLDREIDASRGDTFVHPGNQARLSDDLEAMLVWMSEEPLTPGRRYLFKHATRTVGGSVRTVRYRIDVNSLDRSDADGLGLNEIARVNVVLSASLAVDAYKVNRATGAFIVIDPVSNATVAAGMVLDRARKDPGPEHWDTPAAEGLQASTSRVSARERGDRLGQRPATVLVTGLSGSGKSTVAYELERALFDRGAAVVVLDGENLRLGLSRDLGFSEPERSESLRRASEMARAFNEAGLICICALTAPDAESRERMAQVVGEDHFHVVYLDAPLQVCRARDTTGLYERADRGELQHVAGVGIEYQVPETPALVLHSHEHSPDACAREVMELLRREGVL